MEEAGTERRGTVTYNSQTRGDGWVEEAGTERRGTVTYNSQTRGTAGWRRRGEGRSRTTVRLGGRLGGGGGDGAERHSPVQQSDSGRRLGGGGGERDGPVQQSDSGDGWVEEAGTERRGTVPYNSQTRETAGWRRRGEGRSRTTVRLGGRLGGGGGDGAERHSPVQQSDSGRRVVGGGGERDGPVQQSDSGDGWVEEAGTERRGTVTYNSQTRGDGWVEEAGT